MASYVPAHSGQDGVPEAGTQGGIKQETTQGHSRKARRDADELTHSGYEATEEGACCSVGGKVCLGLLHLLFVDEADVPQAAVGKPIDNGAPQVEGQPGCSARR